MQVAGVAEPIAVVNVALEEVVTTTEEVGQTISVQATAYCLNLPATTPPNTLPWPG